MKRNAKRPKVPTERIRHASALGDQALVQQMREGDLMAWAEFDHRFRALLRVGARKLGIPSDDVETCITEMLDDEAMRLGRGHGTVPPNLTAYLLRALRSAHFTRRRAAMRRARWYADAATELHEGMRVQRLVRTVCSADMLRSSNPALVAENDGNSSGPLGVEGELSTSAAGRWILAFARELSEIEWRMLAWVSEQVPRRSIAEWTDGEYEATKRRLTRLMARLRTRAIERVPELSRDDQREIIDWMRRAGIPYPTVARLLAGSAMDGADDASTDPGAGGKP